jgi:hypothetical protein
MARKFEGADVSNAGRGIRIEVTQRDVDKANGTRKNKGDPFEPDECPAAMAILRSTNAKDVRVHRGVTMLMIGDSWKRYATSSGLRLETIIADRGGRFVIGEFDLKPISTSQLVNQGRPKKKQRTAGMKPAQAKLATRRLVIPGVRRSARQSEEKDD